MAKKWVVQDNEGKYLTHRGRWAEHVEDAALYWTWSEACMASAGAYTNACVMHLPINTFRVVEVEVQVSLPKFDPVAYLESFRPGHIAVRTGSQLSFTDHVVYIPRDLTKEKCDMLAELLGWV